MKKIRFAQISDCHLYADPNQTIQDNNPNTNLKAILQLIAEDNCNYLLLSGDVADEGEPLAYEALAKQIEQLNLNCYYVPGNHDLEDKMREYFVARNIHGDKRLIVDNWQFLFLNSTQRDCTEGYLSQKEMDFLLSNLTHPHLYTVIVLHHHPIPSDSFMDEVMLVQPEAFLKTIQNYGTVRAVLYGHVHQVFEELRGNILFLSAPATAYQIKPGAKEMTVDALTPGYRWLEFEYNGNIKTGISRLPMSKTNVTS